MSFARTCLLLSISVGCSSAGVPAAEREPAKASVSASAPAAPPPLAELPAVAGEPIEALSEGLDEIGYAAIPIGSRSKRPVVIALHGAGGDPAGMCQAGRWLFGPEPFVLCPHGERLNAHTFTWGDPRKMRAAIDRVVRVAEVKYPGRVERESIVWFSHSQAGILGAHALAASGITIRYAVFFEGIPKNPTPLHAAFESAGIERALFITQHPGALPSYRAAARAVGPNVAAKAVFPGAFGHFLRGESYEAIPRELPWLFSGDPLWMADHAEAP